MKALEKVGMVRSDGPSADPAAIDIDDRELERLLAAAGPSRKPAKPSLPTVAMPGVGSRAEVVNTPEEEFDLDELYRRSGIPISVYPIEKLSKLLEGLSAMAPEVRKTAVLALDAADDSWDISDPLTDGLAKIKALNDSKGRLAQSVADAEAQAAAEIKAHDAYLGEAIKEIQRQIAELNQKLAQETQEVSATKSGIQNKLAQRKAAVLGRQSELEAEIAKLQKLVLMFGK